MRHHFMSSTHITVYHRIWCLIISYQIISYHVMSCHVKSYSNIMSIKLYYLILYCIAVYYKRNHDVPYHIYKISSHILSCHITSHFFLLLHFTVPSRKIESYHMLYYIAFYPVTIYCYIVSWFVLRHLHS